MLFYLLSAVYLDTNQDNLDELSLQGLRAKQWQQSMLKFANLCDFMEISKPATLAHTVRE